MEDSVNKYIDAETRKQFEQLRVAAKQLRNKILALVEADARCQMDELVERVAAHHTVVVTKCLDEGHFHIDPIDTGAVFAAAATLDDVDRFVHRFMGPGGAE